MDLTLWIGMGLVTGSAMAFPSIVSFLRESAPIWLATGLLGITIVALSPISPECAALKEAALNLPQYASVEMLHFQNELAKAGDLFRNV